MQDRPVRRPPRYPDGPRLPSRRWQDRTRTADPTRRSAEQPPGREPIAPRPCESASLCRSNRTHHGRRHRRQLPPWRHVTYERSDFEKRGPSTMEQRRRNQVQHSEQRGGGQHPDGQVNRSRSGREPRIPRRIAAHAAPPSAEPPAYGHTTASIDVSVSCAGRGA